MAGVKALRAEGRSMMHQAMDPSRSNRSPEVPRSSAVIRATPCRGCSRPGACGPRPPTCRRARWRPPPRPRPGGRPRWPPWGPVPQLPVAPDGAPPLGLGLAVGLDGRLGVVDLVLGGGEDLVGDGD